MPYLVSLSGLRTPWWEDGVDIGPRTRRFLSVTQINRQNFGFVVGNEVDTAMDSDYALAERLSPRGRYSGTGLLRR
jgi:hypothetical protein